MGTDGRKWLTVNQAIPGAASQALSTASRAGDGWALGHDPGVL